jgi:hypothetical protein
LAKHWITIAVAITNIRIFFINNPHFFPGYNRL